MNTKRYIYLASLSLALAASGCSNEEPTPANGEQALPIQGMVLDIDQAAATTPVTRASVTYSVNTVNDPTKTALNATDRSGWMLDFTLYNGMTKYDAGSFEGGTYDATNKYWIGAKGSDGSAIQYYFPNYLSPGVEVLVYPAKKASAKDNIDIDQSAKADILLQDVLMQKNNSNDTRPSITPAHIIIKGSTTSTSDGIHLVHKHAMLDFAITDFNPNDIDKVTVEITKASSTTTYEPYEVPGLIDMKEYMLILPENTDVDPIIHVTTKAGDEVDAIKYVQTLKVISTKYPKLGTNNCYCFTLQGKALTLSPITVADWARGEAIEGEYIAVTAYPTFKAKGYENRTFYFYYDNKLKESDGKDGFRPKLQQITFNQDGECTIKPDGRILTHILTDANATPAGDNALKTSIILNQMIIDLVSRGALPSNP